ncbi:hypothetical protein LCGC14_3061520, partial [marine sediment metagenome]
MTAAKTAKDEKANTDTVSEQQADLVKAEDRVA